MKRFQWATLVKIFEEKKSAKDPGRPIFGELMKMVYAWELDAVLSWSMDRLSRNDIDEWAIKWALREWRKIREIHTKDSVYDESNIFAMGIFLSLWAEEIANLKKRIMRRMENMVTLEWKVPFHAPLGYKNVGEWRVEVHPEESKTVKRIFQLRKDGKSLQQIADILNDDHVPTRQRDYPWSKKIWTKRLIEKVVKNEFYLWVVKYAQFVGEGLYDRFISDKLFEEVNSEKRMNIGYRHLDFLLKGLVVDHEGNKLTATIKKGKYVYYHNNGWKTKMTEREIFEKVGEVIKLWKIPEDMIQFLEDKIRGDLFKEADALLEEKKLIEKQLEELSRTEYNLTTLCGKGKISEEMLWKQTEDIIKDRKRLSKELEGFSKMNFASIEKFRKTIELVRDLYQFYKNADSVTKGLLIREWIIELKIETDGSLIIHEKEPFYWLSILNVPFGAPSWDEYRTPLMRLMIAIESHYESIERLISIIARV
jgi:site-specific DNA recombinase